MLYIYILNLERKTERQNDKPRKRTCPCKSKCQCPYPCQSQCLCKCPCQRSCPALPSLALSWRDIKLTLQIYKV